MTPLSVLDLWLLAASPFVGSFLSEAARVWPSWSSVFASRSTCAPCGRALTLPELAPIASYVLQKSRCRCGSRRLPLIHPVGDALFVVVVGSAVVFADGWQTLSLIVTGGVLLFAALVDARTMLLPDAATMGLMAFGLLGRALSSMEALADGIVGAVVGFVILFSVNFVFRHLRGRDGLGYGDTKLFAAAGAAAGAATLPLILAVAAALSLCALALVRAFDSKRSIEQMPFGPTLAAATFAMLLWQAQLTAFAV